MRQHSGAEYALVPRDVELAGRNGFERMAAGEQQAVPSRPGRREVSRGECEAVDGVREPGGCETDSSCFNGACGHLLECHDVGEPFCQSTDLLNDSACAAIEVPGNHSHSGADNGERFRDQGPAARASRFVGRLRARVARLPLTSSILTSRYIHGLLV
jgi:hypothetical protein